MIINKIVAIVQARSTSKRFPNKVLKKIGNMTVISCIFERLKKSKLIKEIVFAIPSNNTNDKLAVYLKKKNANVIRGSEKNVLSRYFDAAKKTKATTIVRITGDCPLVDPSLIDKMLLRFLKKPEVDYLSNILPPTYPDGFDVEIFSFKALREANLYASSDIDLEHVTPYIKRSKSVVKDNLEHKKDLSFIRLTIDRPDDLKNVKKIFNYFKKNIFFTLNDILKKPILINAFKKNLKREKKFKSKTQTGQKLWNRAKKIIPGGNMLLSKNPDRFLPGGWPSYYKKAKDCQITDFDGNNFTDVSVMGVGTNILGYGNNAVDAAVKKTINEGNMSTLNCVEEIMLAEKLIEIHPKFDMARFTRTGGEANSVAIRIARAASGKDNIAVCGYHGWHDWYLSANLNNDLNNNLDKHLLKGLEIKGVPKKLKKTTFPFNYGNYEQFNAIINTNNIGVIKMEVCRNTDPDIKFLKHIRNTASKKKIVLIFDECTTGFRQAYGGLHKKINIIPDMAILGKALGNGYAIAAILGKREVMEHAIHSFISSTFWSERIGPTAALKTLEEMEKYKSWNIITKIGKKIESNWKNLFTKYNISASINGIPTLSNFVFKNNHQEYKTLITHEMLKNNFLASTVVYPCIKHTNKILNKYFYQLEDVLKKIKECENGSNIKKFLKIKASSKDFKRLN